MGFDPEAPAFDLTAIREKLANTTGRTYWRSLEEVAETPEFRDFLEAEFPAAAVLWRLRLENRRVKSAAASDSGPALSGDDDAGRGGGGSGTNTRR